MRIDGEAIDPQKFTRAGVRLKKALSRPFMMAGKRLCVRNVLTMISPAY